MTSVEKKLRQKGYDTKKEFPREALERELSKPLAVSTIHSKSPYKCKKNKGDHTFDLVEHTVSALFKMNWWKYRCSACGKTAYRTKPLTYKAK